ncbi:hypothetical protein Tco_1554499 [Tanacetum coccineum]
MQNEQVSHEDELKRVALITNSMVAPYRAHISSTSRLVKRKNVDQDADVLTSLRKLKVNIPHVEALKSMSEYSRSLEDLLKNKSRIDDEETTKINEWCSAWLDNILPLHCLIGKYSFSNDLIDLRASVSGMPYTIFTSLGLGEFVPTKLKVELADKTIKLPLRIVENVLVKINKFNFLIDFIVFDMPENMIFGAERRGNGRVRGEKCTKEDFHEETTIKIGKVDIDTLTMKQSLAFTRGNQGRGMVKHAIRNNVNFEIKSDFMRELREDTFLGNKHVDSHEHVRKLEEIHNFKQEGDETLYQAWKGTVTCFTNGPIPGIKPAQALESIQTLADHSQKWHDVSRRTSDGTHIDKDCPPNKEVKRVEEVKYGKFGISFSNNGGNGAGYCVGQLGYYRRMENRPPFGEEKPTKAAKEAPSSSAPIGHYKVIFADNYAQSDEIYSNEINELHGVSFIFDHNVQVSKKENEGPSGFLPSQLPPTELSLGSFTLPNTICSLNMYALADLGGRVNILPYSLFKYLKPTSLKETSMFIEMADMSKKAPMGIVENVLLKIDKFVFPSDFVITDMLGDPNETMILEEESFNPSEIGEDLFSYDSPLCLEFEKYNHVYDTNENNEDTFVCDYTMQEPIIGHKGKTMMAKRVMVTWRLHSCRPIQIIDEHGVLANWYGNNKIDDTIMEMRYDEWFPKNNRDLSYEAPQGHT